MLFAISVPTLSEGGGSLACQMGSKRRVNRSPVSKGGRYVRVRIGRREICGGRVLQGSPPEVLARASWGWGVSCSVGIKGMIVCLLL